MTQDATPGTLIGLTLGGYHLVALVGTGGMAEVYRGVALRTGREVAVKVLPPALARDPSYVSRFRDEAMCVVALNHPHVVPVLAFAEDRGYFYIVMPLLQQSLRERLDREPTMHPVEAAGIVVQIASALDAAHTHGLVHRDVKPENILLDGNGLALLTDFGIARELDVLRDATSARTPAITGLPVGTPEYMPPEQLRGGPADQRVDVYALGAVLYEMLTGRVPHDAATPHEIAIKTLTERTLPPSVFNRGIWRELEDVILGALASDPHARYPNMHSFAAALHRAVLQSAPYSRPLAGLPALHQRAPERSLATRRLEDATVERLSALSTPLVGRSVTTRRLEDMDTSPLPAVLPQASAMRRPGGGGMRG